MKEVELPRDAKRSQSKCYDFDVRVGVDLSYRVLYEPGLIERYGAVLERELGPRRLIVVTDKRVQRLHGARFVRSLRATKPVDVIVVPEGERSKSLATFLRLLERLEELHCDRRTVLVCFGGGMISDLGGFVASAYMRGITYVNFATSLLGQIDACVGGKVAVNSRNAKNLIGAFYHPRHVAGDPGLLATLSARDFKSGLAEGIKMAIIDGPELFELLEGERARIKRGDPEILTRVIGLAAEKKMAIIGLDPYEKDLRRSLNLGHTIGHPIETEFQYRGIRHGEAVAIGMAVAISIALDKGILPFPEAERMLDLLESYGLLSFGEPIRPDSVIEHVRYVRLIRGNDLHFVLPRGIGDVLITNDVTNADLVRGFERYERIVQDRSA